MSRKNDVEDYVEASASAATVLPGVPLPAWTHLGEPEPEPTPEPAPEPMPEPATVMELVSVGAVATAHHGRDDLGALSAPHAEPAAYAAPAGIVSVGAVSAPDSLDQFAPPVASVPVAAAMAPVLAPPVPEAPPAPQFAAPAPALAPPVPQYAAPAPVLAPPVPQYAAPAPVLAPPVPEFAAPAPVLAPTVPQYAAPVPVLAPPAPELAAPAPAMAPPSPAFAPPPVPALEIPTLEPLAPETAAPVADMAAVASPLASPLLFSAPAPFQVPTELAPVAPDAVTVAAPAAVVPDVEAIVPAAPVVFDPAGELTAAEQPTEDDDSTDAPKSRRPLIMLLVLGIVAILGAVAAFVYPGLLVSQDPEPTPPVVQQAAPKTATLAVPATVAGLDSITGAPAAALSAAATSTTLAGFSAPVSGVYGKAGVPGATVIAWTAASSSPRSSIDAAFAGFQTASSTAVTDIAEVPMTGGLTGQMSCGTGTVNAAPATVCFWADATTFGAVTILKPTTPKDGALTAVAVRQAVETIS